MNRYIREHRELRTVKLLQPLFSLCGDKTWTWGVCIVRVPFRRLPAPCARLSVTAICPSIGVQYSLRLRTSLLHFNVLSNGLHCRTVALCRRFTLCRAFELLQTYLRRYLHFLLRCLRHCEFNKREKRKKSQI